MTRELTCIGCPMGCELTVEVENGEAVSVSAVDLQGSQTDKVKLLDFKGFSNQLIYKALKPGYDESQERDKF